MNKLLPTQNTPELQAMRGTLKGSDHGYAHARRLSLQNKFVGSTPFSSPEPLGLILTETRRIDLSVKKDRLLTGLNSVKGKIKLVLV